MFPTRYVAALLLGLGTLFVFFPRATGANAGEAGDIVFLGARILPLGRNTAPVAVNDAAVLPTGGKVMLHLTANDSDIDGNLDPTTLAVSTTPANGSTSVDAVNGRITYTHNGGVSTSDLFEYTVGDSGGLTSNMAQVAITIDNSDRIPAAHFNLPPSLPSTAIPPNLTQTGAFADLATLTPNPGIVPYEANVAFWSDHAIKSRWFAVPELVDKIAWSRDLSWTFPEGTVWVKHFDLEEERGNPATKFRVETRLLVKTNSGVYGLSYHWNPGGTEASLVPSVGMDLDFSITVGGNPQLQTYHIPGRNECLQCHTNVAGGALSFNTRQLNRTANIFGVSQNQISGIEQAGYFSSPTDPVNTLPWFARHDETDQSVEFRVRSYLAVNCVSCHQPGGAGPPNWNARPENPLPLTGLINGMAFNNGGVPTDRLVVPGSSTESILLHRLSACCGFSRMPPLATNELDTDSIQLVTDWIDLELASYLTYQQWRQIHFGSTTSAEGEPGADPDGDDCTNRKEFLTRTDPNNVGDRWSPTFEGFGGIANFSFVRVHNRSFQIEVSNDMKTWWLWDVPGNRPSFSSSTIPGAILQGAIDTGTYREFFYRWIISEP